MKTEKRTEVLATRLSEREALEVAQLAKDCHLSVSDFIRSLLFPEGKRLPDFTDSQLDVE